MKTARISLSLPRDLLRAVERERRETGESRSEFVRRALAGLLEDRRHGVAIDRYIRGYELHPESPEEAEGLAAVGLATLAEEPWAVDS